MQWPWSSVIPWQRPCAYKTPVSSDDPVRHQEDYAACCCAIQNFMLFMWQAGVGVKWSSGKITSESQFFDILGLDAEKVMIVGLFWYGYPAQVPEQRRKPLTDICTLLPWQSFPA